MAALAMWFQDASGTALSAGGEKWLLIFVGIIAGCMLVLLLGIIFGGLQVLKVMRDVKSTMSDVRSDLKNANQDFKAKLDPLIENITRVSAAAHEVLTDAKPKVKIITEHLAETSKIVRESAGQLQQTVTDLNSRTQKQVSRVDGMVTGALNTTAEVAATIEHGIRVPAQKIAAAATQAKSIMDSVIARIREVSSGLPFMRQTPTATASTAAPASPFTAAASGARPTPPSAGTPTTPRGASGSIPLVK